MISIYRRVQVALTIGLLSVLASTLTGQEVRNPEPVALPVSGDVEGKLLYFSFERAPWRDVIKWLADECHLALHFEDLPTGSFSYSDSNSFTSAEAIDRVNLFLLPQDFALVRSGKLLSVINLASPRGMQQLDSLAKFVTADQLEQAGSHDVVKCLFPIGELEAEDAVQELSALNLMTTPVILNKTNQLVITDTVSKLRNVKAVLQAFQPAAMDNGTVVKSFALKHVDAEDVLAVARPHLGLATGEMIGIDVSLSADLQGRHIFVTGIEDKVKLIEGLVLAIDQPKEGVSVTDSEMELRSHRVEGGNVETVYNVLQTLLADETLRLSMDQTASSIVALAAPEVQAEIAQTVTQLQAAEADFEVIPLKTVDPYLVISLLEELLDLPDALDDPEDIDPDAPKIDADPGNMQLYVRAKRHQIDQIKKIVAELETGQSGLPGEDLRVLPFRGAHVEGLLKTAAKFWRRENPIIFFPATIDVSTPKTERAINSGSNRPKLTAVLSRESRPEPAQFLTDNVHSQAPAIRCQLTPRGLLIQSDDRTALDQFEEHLRAIAGPGDSLPSPPIVFYLKYTKPEDALRMLAELLDGGESALEGEAGSLVNGYVSSSGSFLGSFVSSRDGTTTMTAGTMTVVADSRLNRLIAQGTASDIETIESYLEIIDKDSSITSIETYGTSHVIELKYTQATEVAATIREAYAGRVLGATGAPAQQKQPSGGQPAQRDAGAAKGDGGGGDSKNGDSKNNEKKAPAKKPASQPSRSLEPKMTIAVHEPSNSLIVTAPKPLLKEVEQLAKLIDSRSEQTVQVLSPVNAALLESVFSGSTPGGGTRSSSSDRSRAPSTPSRSPVSSLLRSKFAR